MRSFFILALSLTALAVSRTANAHARLDHASPAVGSVVTPAPKEIALWFTEAIEPKFSTIEVRDAKGTAIQDGAASGVPGNIAQLRVPLKSLKPGTYRVKWRVLSVDTHRTQGDFTFRVGP